MEQCGTVVEAHPVSHNSNLTFSTKNNQTITGLSVCLKILDTTSRDNFMENNYTLYLIHHISLYNHQSPYLQEAAIQHPVRGWSFRHQDQGIVCSNYYAQGTDNIRWLGQLSDCQMFKPCWNHRSTVIHRDPLGMPRAFNLTQHVIYLSFFWMENHQQNDHEATLHSDVQEIKETLQGLMEEIEALKATSRPITIGYPWYILWDSSGLSLLSHNVP